MKEQALRLSCLRLRIVLYFLGCVSFLIGQQKIEIVDQENNEPLIGATILVKPQSIGYITDVNGAAFITHQLAGNEDFEISYVGYDKRVISFSDLSRDNFKVTLSPSQSILEEVLLVYRKVNYKSDILSPLKQIDAAEIEALQVQTPADLLEKSGSVFVQKSQMGGGSPVIRGFEANKVLLVLDGVRMNNAIYRSGHLQSSITLDEQILESVDVIFGPGSIAFGSDALGGVIHYKSKTPKLSQDWNQNGNVLMRYSSANNEKTVHANYEFGSKRVSGLFGVTLSDFGNLRMGSNYPEAYPDFGKRFDYALGSDNPSVNLENELVINEDPNVQVGTQYDQQDYFAKIKYSATEKLNLVFNGQFSTSSNIPRYDNLTERNGAGLKFAEWHYGPQKRSLLSMTANLTSDSKMFDQLYFIASHQSIGEDRISRGFGSTEREENLEDLSVIGLTLDFNKTIANKYGLIYGFDFQHNQLNSSASQNIFTRYPNGGNQMSLYGLYSKIAIPLIKKDKMQLSWNNGIRYSVTDISLNYERDNFFEWPSYFYDGLNSQSNNLSFLSALNYRRPNLNLNLVGGTAFRAPNIDDLAKTRVKIDEITIPNPELSPEKTVNGELQISVGSESNYVGGSIFAVGLRDAIVRQDFTLPDGSATYINGNDTLIVTANVNAEKAKVYGFSTRMGLSRGNFGLNASLTWTKGERIETSGETSPLGHIPPLFSVVSLTHKLDKFSQELNVRLNGKKALSDYGGSVDNPEYATPEGTLAWQTINYYGNYKHSDKISIQFGVENILDRNYRTFSSGLSAPGRNFILTFKCKI